MKEFIGKVWIREIEMVESSESVMEVTNDKKETFDDLLFDFEGKNVKITIQVIE